jgi:hypothetical protein
MLEGRIRDDEVEGVLEEWQRRGPSMTTASST